VYSKINSTFLGGNFSVQAYNQCGSTAMRYHTVSKICPTTLVIYNDSEIENNDLTVTTLDDVLSDPEYIISLSVKMDFIVYPNPGKGTIQLRIYKGEEEYYLVEIKNNLNQTVYQGLKETEDSMNLSELLPGVYLITVSDKNGNIMTKQLIIL